MFAFLKPHRMDLACISGLILIASIPLIALRNFVTVPTPVFYPIVGFSAAAWLALLWAWRRAGRAGDLAGDHPPSPGSTGGPALSPARWAAVAAALGVLTAVNFYLPLRKHFWGGGDEHIMFIDVLSCFWNANMDLGLCRPLWLLPIGLGQLMTPDRVDGFLVLAALLCLANGLLLTGITAHFFRDDWLIPLAAGALLIVNPCDLSRFYVIWTSLAYWTTLFFLLLAVRLYLASYTQGSRLLLAGACVALTAAGLGNEGISLMAFLAPGLVWLSRGQRRGEKNEKKEGQDQQSRPGSSPLALGPSPLAPWLFAWYGTLALVAGRFGVHLLLVRWQDGYQARVLASANLTPDRLLNNASVQLSAFLSYFQVPSAQALRLFGTPWAAVLGAFIAACVLARVGRAARGGEERAARGEGRTPACRLAEPFFTLAPLWRHLIGAAVAVLAGLAGLAPFLPIAWPFRTQFLAGPGQAAFLACAVNAVAACLPRPVRTCAGLALTGWLLVSATACAWAGQQRARDENPISFDTVVDALEHVHAVSPHYAPGTLLLFVLDADSPFGSGYALDFIAYKALDHAAAAQTGDRASFTAQGVRSKNWAVAKELYGYDQLVLFRISGDGETSLLEKVPAFLVPAGTDTSAYAPAARMRPGPVAPVPFFRPLAGLRPPHDVLEYGDGVLLGAGWGELEYAKGGKLSCQARDGAAVLINPAGPAAQGLTFLVDAGAAASGDPGRPLAVEALDESGAVAATAEVGPGGAVRLAPPLRPDRINHFCLRLRGGDPAAPRAFRVTRAGQRVPWHSKYARRRKGDITGDGLLVGRNWHGLEGVLEGPLFRWVDNDAEVYLSSLGHASALRLEVEPGPSLGGRPCELSVADASGRHLGERTVTGRMVISFPLPPGEEGAVLHLSCMGGGEHIPTDPRVMNFRVFRVELAAGDAPAAVGGR